MKAFPTTGIPSKSSRLSLGGLLSSRARLLFTDLCYDALNPSGGQGRWGRDGRRRCSLDRARFPAPKRLVEFDFALVENGLGSTFEFVFRSDVADCAVQPNVVVIFGELADNPPRVSERKRRFWADAFALERLMKALDFTVALRIKRRSAHVCHPGQADEFFEVAGDELRAVVGDDSRAARRGVFPVRAG